MRIRQDELGLVFRDDQLIAIREPGASRHKTWFGSERIEIISQRQVICTRSDVENLVRSKVLKQSRYAEVLTLQAGQAALLWVNGQLAALLVPGQYVLWTGYHSVRVDHVSQREVLLRHQDSDLIVGSPIFAVDGAAQGVAEVLSVGQDQAALVWVDDLFYQMVLPGKHLLWKGQHRLRIEFLSTAQQLCEHPAMDYILATKPAELEVIMVPDKHYCALSVDGSAAHLLPPGRHVVWRLGRTVKLCQIDTREQVLDVSGQELLTADPVSLRCNLLVTYRVADVPRVAAEYALVTQGLYRQAQLALRESIGQRSLEVILRDKSVLSQEIAEHLSAYAHQVGLALGSVGVRDVILPGEIKTLLTQVTEAKVAAEAQVVHRREEVAALRSQANSAKMLADNPTLMRLHELEVLKTIATSGKLELFGNETIMNRVSKMI